MINLNLKKFLKIIFSFIGIAYLLTFIYSIFTNFDSASVYEVGLNFGHNLAFATTYILMISITMIALFVVNLLILKLKSAKH